MNMDGLSNLSNRLAALLHPIVYLRGLLVQWLGIDDLAAIVHREEAARMQDEEDSAALAESVMKLTTVLTQAAQQLNANTIIIHRWAHKSAILNEIERTHAREQRRANGDSLVTLDRT